MTDYGITIERLNEDGEPYHIYRITLIEQEGQLQTGTRFYEMRDVDGPHGLVVQDPGESMFALAASAWEKCDHIMKKKEG